MIHSFKCRETQKLYEEGEQAKKLPPEIQRSARRKLQSLNSAHSIQDVRVPPSNHLEKLRGDRLGQFSIRINAQWRICFVWQDGSAHDVEIVDYH